MVEMATISVGVKFKVLLHALNDLTLVASPLTLNLTIRPLGSSSLGTLTSSPFLKQARQNRTPGLLHLLLLLKVLPSQESYGSFLLILPQRICFLPTLPQKNYLLNKAFTVHPTGGNNPHTHVHLDLYIP